MRWRQAGKPLIVSVFALSARSEIFVGLPSFSAVAFVIPSR